MDTRRSVSTNEGCGLSTQPIGPIRVLQVIAGLDPVAGGPPTSAVATSLALRRQGVVASFAYVVIPGREPLAAANTDLLRTAGVNVYSFPVTAFAGERGVRWGFSLRLAGWLLRNARRFDVIHAHAGWTFTTAAGLAAARLCGRVAVLSAHESLTDFDRAKSPPVVRLVKRVLRRAYLRLFDVVVIASPLEQRDSGDSRGERTAIVPHAVRAVVPSTHTDREGVALRVGFLGRIHPKKNLEVLIRAVANAGCDAQLIVAGDGPATYVDPLRRLAVGLGIGDRVKWLGFLGAEEKGDFLGSIDVLAMPSKYESFGIAAVEALSAGVPVIVSPTVGVSYVISGHRAGLVVRPDRDLLASAIERFAEDTSFLDAAKENTHAAVEEFSLDRHAASMRREYLRLLGWPEGRVIARNRKNDANGPPKFRLARSDVAVGRHPGAGSPTVDPRVES
jgi:glycosyltransferase involved in cell wall biosynthesis